MKKLLIVMMSCMVITLHRVNGMDILCAAKNNQVTQVKEALQRDSQMHINKKTPWGQTALHCAAYNNHGAVIDLLLQYGADVNSKDLSGNTPLHWAAIHGNLDVIKSFVADPNIRINECNKDGITPLHRTAINGHVLAARLLIEKGAFTNLKDNHNWSPLHSAAFRGNNAVMEVLIKNNAFINDKNNNGETPLHLALLSGYEAAVNVLLADPKIVVTLPNNHGKTPLQFASKNGNEKMINLLQDWLKRSLFQHIESYVPLTSVQNTHKIIMKIFPSIGTAFSIGNRKEEFLRETILEGFDYSNNQVSFISCKPGDRFFMSYTYPTISKTHTPSTVMPDLQKSIINYYPLLFHKKLNYLAPGDHLEIMLYDYSSKNPITVHLPYGMNNKILQYLTNDLEASSRDCFDFFKEVFLDIHNNKKKNKGHLIISNTVSNFDCEPGDGAIFADEKINKNESPVDLIHFAIALGYNLFISKLGTAGFICICDQNSLQALYQCNKFYRVTLHHTLPSTPSLSTTTFFKHPDLVLHYLSNIRKSEQTKVATE